MRIIIFAILILGALGFAVYLMRVVSKTRAFADPVGKIIVAVIIAAVAFWLFGGGALLE